MTCFQPVTRFGRRLLPVALSVFVFSVGLLGCEEKRTIRVFAPSTTTSQGEVPPQQGVRAEYPDQVFAAAMERLARRYRDAGNEIQKSAVYREARAFEATFFGQMVNVVTDWKGVVSDLSTTKGGRSLMLRVTLKSPGGLDIDFEQGFGLDSNVDSGTSVYAEAANLREGSCVVFSGRVRPKEDSVTESGAMSNPEYKIEFTALKPCVARSVFSRWQPGADTWEALLPNTVDVSNRINDAIIVPLYDVCCDRDEFRRRRCERQNSDRTKKVVGQTYLARFGTNGPTYWDWGYDEPWKIFWIDEYNFDEQTFSIEVGPRLTLGKVRSRCPDEWGSHWSHPLLTLDPDSQQGKFHVEKIAVPEATAPKWKRRNQEKDLRIEVVFRLGEKLERVLTVQLLGFRIVNASTRDILASYPPTAGDKSAGKTTTRGR